MKTILSFLHVLFVSAYVALASASNNGTKSEAFANSTNEVDVARRQIPSVVCPTGCMNNYAHTTGNCLCSDGAAGGQTCGDGTIASLSEGDLFCYNNGICMSNAGACPNPLPGLFISEMIEGSKYNRAVELYNPTAADIDLSLYYLGQTVNGWCQASFEDRRAGACGDDFPVPQKLIKLSDTGVATLASGATYVLCHSQAIAGDGSRGVVLSDACTHDAVDQAHPINFNGDDAIVLISGTAGSWKVVDSVGAIGPDPGTAFDVCGVSRGTKDKTLVRKPAVVFGNGGDWTASSGTTADDCEWIVFDKDTGTEMASHECVLPLSLATPKPTKSPTTTAPTPTTPSPTTTAPTPSPTPSPTTTAPTPSPTTTAPTPSPTPSPTTTAPTPFPTPSTCILKNDDPSCSDVNDTMQAFCPDYAIDVGVKGKPEYGCNAKMCKKKDQKYEARLHQAMLHGMFGGESGSGRACKAWCLYDVEEHNRHFRWNNKKGCWKTRKTRQRACKDSTKEEREFVANIFDNFCAV